VASPLDSDSDAIRLCDLDAASVARARDVDGARPIPLARHPLS